jgi:hypothetical protein
MDKYEFIGHWTDTDTPPTSATRCLVTDGDLVVIATYVSNNGKNSMWMFQGLNEGAQFHVIGWMPLPRPIEKPVVEPVSKDEIPKDTNMVGG